MATVEFLWDVLCWRVEEGMMNGGVRMLQCICKTDEVMYLEKHFSKSCGFFNDKRERERKRPKWV